MTIERTIAFVGGGNMARALIGGMLANGQPAAKIRVGEPSADARAALSRDLGVETFADGAKACTGADVCVLAVKPQVMKAVCESLSALSAETLLISIAAGISTHQITQWLGHPASIVRAMPNTPALVGLGATGLYANAQVTAEQRDAANHLLESVGIVRWIDDESLIDAVTALSGSGPAYIFLLAEAMIAAAQQQGLDADTAKALAIQTIRGAGELLATSADSPAQLRRNVTSPNGTTQTAIESFDRDNFSAIVQRALDAARDRGRELAE